MNNLSAIKPIWQQLTAGCEARGLSDLLFSQLCEAYSEAHRHYHTLAHLQHLFGLLQAAHIFAPEVYWAAFYHDYIYRPSRGDNEAKSARVAEDCLAQLGFDAVFIARVSALIAATKTHQIDTGDLTAMAFLDADMAILGEAPVRYQSYAQAVTQEFKSIPTFLYKAGRKKFLRKLLAQEKIFHSAWFFQRFEVQARENILRELELSA